MGPISSLLLPPVDSYLRIPSVGASEERPRIWSRRSEEEPGVTTLEDVRVHRCFLEFFLEPCVAPTISSLHVWPAAMKWANELQSSWPGSLCLSLLALERPKGASCAPK